MQSIVRPIEHGDFEDAQAVYRAAALGVPDGIYSPSIKAEWANRTNSEFLEKSFSRQRFVAQLGKTIVGYVGYDQNRSTLTECYVLPAYQGFGIGKQLVKRVLRCANEDRLEKLTVLASKNAVQFYEGCGFSVERAEALVMGDGRLLDCYRMSIYLAAG
jgi:GNAT superfamily N-acetyltransferase